MEIRSRIKILCAAVLVFSLAACSTSKKKEGDNPDIVPAAEAGTDVVPAEDGTNPPPPPAENADASATPPPAGAADAGSPPPPPSSSESAGTGQADDYTVQSGDTLMKIAFETYGDLFKWKDLYAANKEKISDPNKIAKGMVIKVERPASPPNIDKSGEKYLIQKGDTLGIISKSLYGSTSRWKDLWDKNRTMIKDPNKIFAGFYLYYNPANSLASAPAAGSAVSAAPAAPAQNAPAAPAGGTPPPPAGG